MKSFYVLCWIYFVCTIGACKQDPVTQQAPETPVVADTIKAAPSPTPVQPADQSVTGGHDYTFLTDKLLLYKMVYNGDQQSKDQPFKDEWIDFDPNGTFKAGKNQKQTHTGQWSYNHETKILFLRPDVKEFKMSEWKVLFNDQMIVWVGTQTYGDNKFQIKLVRSSTLPE